MPQICRSDPASVEQPRTICPGKADIARRSKTCKSLAEVFAAHSERLSRWVTRKSIWFAGLIATVCLDSLYQRFRGAPRRIALFRSVRKSSRQSGGWPPLVSCGESKAADELTRQKKVSGRWGCRPLVGMGVMEVQTFEVAFKARPESTPRMPVVRAGVDRPDDSIGPGTNVPRLRFEVYSPMDRDHDVLAQALNSRNWDDRLRGYPVFAPTERDTCGHQHKTRP
jgi:hypothetical protein